MDANCFDRFTRSFAGALSRRSTLGVAFSGAIGSLLGRADLEAKKRKKGKKGKKKKGKGKPKGAQCRTSQSDGVVTTTLSFSRKPFSLTSVETTPLDPREPQTNTMTIREKGSLLLETQTTVQSDGPIEVRVAYGKLYSGIAEGLFTVNGGMVSGTIDGRALVPFPATETPDTFQFQDGQPAPETTVNGKLHEAMTKFLRQASVERAKCVVTSGRKERAGRPRSHDDGACTLCKGACVVTRAGCGHAILATCGKFGSIPIFGGVAAGVCIAIETKACIDDLRECLDDCRSNEDCCPVQCGTLGDLSCCHADEQCLTFGTGLGQCCAPGETACHEQNCCKPGETCMPGGTCCPTVPCGGSCCNAFDSCCGGQCCSGTCNGNVCCTGGATPCGSGCCNGACCNGTCCGAGQVCCNGACCLSGYDCQNNTCVQVCSPGQIPCFGQCCAPSQTCQLCPNGTHQCSTGLCTF
jgi:hypothetical protein